MANDRVRKASAVAVPAGERKTVILTAAARKRLETAAVAEGLDESEIVEGLINRNLAGYVIHVKGPRFTRDEDRPSPAVDVNSPAQSAA